MVVFLVFTAANVRASENAAQLHSSALSEVVTTWCIGHPERFVAAAKSLGYETADAISGTTDITDLKFPSGGEGSILGWARRRDTVDSDGFEEICEMAFNAFGAGSTQSSEDSEEEKAALVILGGLIAGLTGLGTERKRTRNEEGSGLRKASGELKEAVGRYVKVKDDGAALDARVKGTALRQQVQEWSKFDGDEAAKAEGLLSDILRKDGNPPYIGSLGDLAEHKKNGETLNNNVASIDDCVLKIARRVEAVTRLLKKRGIPTRA
jgi:hypothetical protein